MPTIEHILTDEETHVELSTRIILNDDSIDIRVDGTEGDVSVHIELRDGHLTAHLWSPEATAEHHEEMVEVILADDPAALLAKYTNPDS